MEINLLASGLLQQPTPELLWDLRAFLLTQESPAEDKQRAALYDLVSEFYSYLSELRSKTSARGYNRLASLFDLASVGVLAMEDVLTLRERVTEKILLGGLAESLMVLGSFQYVKAWDRETELIHERAAWFLYGELWRFSLSTQPSLSTEKRQELVNSLLAPLRSDGVSTPVKVALAGRVFQILLLTYLARFLPVRGRGKSAP